MSASTAASNYTTSVNDVSFVEASIIKTASSWTSACKRR